VRGPSLYRCFATFCFSNRTAISRFGLIVLQSASYVPAPRTGVIGRIHGPAGEIRRVHIHTSVKTPSKRSKREIEASAGPIAGRPIQTSRGMDGKDSISLRFSLSLVPFAFAFAFALPCLFPLPLGIKVGLQRVLKKSVLLKGTASAVPQVRCS
jgi:hypothetical protein